jgi:hypothetical protein
VVAVAAGDERVAAQHKQSLRGTLVGTAAAMGAMGLVHFVAPLFGGGGSLAGAPQMITGVQTLISDMTDWLLALVPVGGGLVAGYHWFMSGPGSD